MAGDQRLMDGRVPLLAARQGADQDDKAHQHQGDRRPERVDQWSRMLDAVLQSDCNLWSTLDEASGELDFDKRFWSGLQRADSRPQFADNVGVCRLSGRPVVLTALSESPARDALPPESVRKAALCPLNRVRAGCVVIIKELTAAPETNQRLREMGFGEEQRVKVVTLQNNVLCQVCNARLGLSAKLAESILVQQVSSLRLAA